MTRAHERFARLLDAGSNPVSLKAGTVRGGAYAIAGEGVDFFLRMASVVVLARLLVPEYFGLIGMVTAITAIADRFKELGLQSATIQSPTLTHRQASTLFWVNAAMGAAIMAVVVAAAYPIARFYQDDRLLFITVALAIGFVWSGASNQHYALLRRAMRYRELAVIQVVASASSIVVAVVLAWKGYGYWALVAREVSRNVFGALGVWAAFPWVPGAPTRDAEVVRMLRFGADITAFNLIYFLSISLDHILIGRIFGAHQLGFYRQGYQLVLAPMNQISFPVRVIAESALSRLQHDGEAYRRYFRSIVGALAYVTFPLGLFMAVYADEIVRVVLGSAWLEATPIFRIMALAAVMHPVVGMSGAVLVTCGHSRRFFWVGLAASASLVAFFLAGIPFGPEGVASAHIWSLWLLLLPRLYWSFKDTPIRPAMFLSTLARPAIGSAVMVAALVAVRGVAVTEAPVARLVLGLAVAILAYLGAVVMIPGGRAELVRLIVAFSGPLGLGRFLPARLRGRGLEPADAHEKL